MDMETLNSIVSFVGKGNAIVEDYSAQTGDLLFGVILGFFVLALVCFGLVAFAWNRKKVTVLGTHSSSVKFQKITIMSIIGIILLTVACLWFNNATSAHADENGTIAKCSDKVIVVVDEVDGTVVVEPGKISSVEKEALISEITINAIDDVNPQEFGVWKVSISDKVVYEDVIGRTVSIDSRVTDAAIKIEISGLSGEKAKSLIGKDVAKFSFTANPSPTPSEKEEAETFASDLLDEYFKNLDSLNLSESSKLEYESEMQGIFNECVENIAKSSSKEELDNLLKSYQLHMDKVLNNAKEESLKNTKQEALVNIAAQVKSATDLIESLKNLTEYQVKDFQDRLSEIDEQAKKDIDNAQSEEEVQKLLNLITSKITALINEAKAQDAAELEKAKKSATDNINGMYESALTFINNLVNIEAADRDPILSQLHTILTDGKEGILGSDSKANIQQILEDAKKAIDNLVAQAKEKDEQALKDAKEAAIASLLAKLAVANAEIENLANLEPADKKGYSDAIQGAFETAKLNVDDVSDKSKLLDIIGKAEASFNEAIAAAKAKDKQNLEDAIAAAKTLIASVTENAKTKLQGMTLPTSVRTNYLSKISEKNSTAISSLESASTTSIAIVNNIVTTFNTDINAILIEAQNLKYYSVSISQPQHGTITSEDIEDNLALYNNNIKLSYTAQTGYEQYKLASITVNEGFPITATNNVATFTMPNMNVDVACTEMVAVEYAINYIAQGIDASKDHVLKTIKGTEAPGSVISIASQEFPGHQYKTGYQEKLTLDVDETKNIVNIYYWVSYSFKWLLDSVSVTPFDEDYKENKDWTISDYGRIGDTVTVDSHKEFEDKRFFITEGEQVSIILDSDYNKNNVENKFKRIKYQITTIGHWRTNPHETPLPEIEQIYGTTSGYYKAGWKFHASWFVPEEIKSNLNYTPLRSLYEDESLEEDVLDNKMYYEYTTSLLWVVYQDENGGELAKFDQIVTAQTPTNLDREDLHRGYVCFDENIHNYQVDWNQIIEGKVVFNFERGTYQYIIQHKIKSEDGTVIDFKKQEGTGLYGEEIGVTPLEEFQWDDGCWYNYKERTKDKIIVSYIENDNVAIIYYEVEEIGYIIQYAYQDPQSTSEYIVDGDKTQNRTGKRGEVISNDSISQEDKNLGIKETHPNYENCDPEFITLDVGLENLITLKYNLEETWGTFEIYEQNVDETYPDSPTWSDYYPYYVGYTISYRVQLSDHDELFFHFQGYDQNKKSMDFDMKLKEDLDSNVKKIYLERDSLNFKIIAYWQDVTKGDFGTVSENTYSRRYQQTIKIKDVLSKTWTHDDGREFTMDDSYYESEVEITYNDQQIYVYYEPTGS